MDINYNDIDFCINSLYKYLYNSNTETVNCVELIENVKNELSIVDVKNFDLTLSNKQNILTNIKFINKNDNLAKFKKTNTNSHPATISIRPYDKKNSNHNSLKRPEIIDLLVKLTLSELVLNKQVKFIELPIMNFDIEYKNLSNEIKNYYKNDQNDVFLVSIAEHFFSSQSLHTFLLENELSKKDFSILIFQIFYTLYKIQQLYPTFRHNQLNLENILIYKKKVASNKFKNYSIGSTDYKIPETFFDVRISNFYYSSIKDLFENNISKNLDENLYYDVHYFLHSLLNFYNDQNKQIPAFVQKFIFEIIPKEYRYENFIGLDEAYYNKNVNNILTPLFILQKNIFFTHFIIDKMNISASSTENSNYNIENSLSHSIEKSQTADLIKGKAKFIKSKKSKIPKTLDTLKGERTLNVTSQSDSDTDSVTHSDSQVNSDIRADSFINDSHSRFSESSMQVIGQQQTHNPFMNLFNEQRSQAQMNPSQMNQQQMNQQQMNQSMFNKIPAMSQMSNGTQMSQMSQMPMPQFGGVQTDLTSAVTESKTNEHTESVTESATSTDSTSETSPEVESQEETDDESQDESQEKTDDDSQEETIDNAQEETDDDSQEETDDNAQEETDNDSQEEKEILNNDTEDIELMKTKINNIVRNSTDNTTENFNIYSTTSLDTDNNEQTLMGGKRHKSSKKSKSYQKQSSQSNPILTKLPENYSGPVPEHLQGMLADPSNQMNDMQQMPQMPQMNGMSQMPQMNGMPQMSQMNGMNGMQQMPQMNGMNGMQQMPQMNQIGQIMGQMDYNNFGTQYSENTLTDGQTIPAYQTGGTKTDKKSFF